MNVSLRPLEDSDLDVIFEQMKDPESVKGNLKPQGELIAYSLDTSTR